MATIPTPRSYSQIVGDMLDSFLSKTGLPAVRVGSPHLSIIEAGAQSDLRSSQDIFNLLNSKDLDRATGQALDRIGADEDTPRIGESSASGLVTISDTSFEKLESKIFQGLPPPIVGSDKVYVANALAFPASGQIYIGRGTGNYEGPLDYTSKVNNTNYWTLNLASGSHTTRYHNLGESVVLAQGGNRTIGQGATVQTSQGNTGTAVQFSLLYTAVIPDGETSIDSVTVVAKTPGLIGNVVANSITGFSSPPFTGAAVTNPLPYSNGLATEDDNTYRERIRAVRQSRSRGTPLALKTFITGITASDENKRVLSANVVTREGFPTTLYIDDGTGYEEKDIGIAIESIVDEALGGEQYFQLVHGRPVAKAYAEATLEAPYDLTAASVLAVLVGGVRSEHAFSSDQFRNIRAASAYEVVASINGNEDALFSARTTNSGKTFAVFAKSDVNEDVEVVEPSSGFTDANPSFEFPVGRVDTLRLYKNDRLLSKDGQLAILAGNTQGLWAPINSPATFAIRIDGVDVATSPVNTYTITDTDFVDADTGYVTLSHTNSLEAWAKVLNFKIPGITATVSGGALVLTSNRGRSADASLEISACDLVSKNLFSVGSSTGKDRDYTFDRNLGQGRLEDGLILHETDKLTAGSIATRAFLESADLVAVTLNSVATTVSGESGAELWFVVDGSAEIVKTSISTASPITITLQATTSFKRVRIAHTSGAAIFANAQIGDWLLATDLGFDIINRGAFRIAEKDASGTWVEIERPSSWATPEAISLTAGGLYVIRTEADVQRVYIPAGVNYTALSLANSISAQLRGATATLYRTNRFRVRTNSFLTGGDIALVAANSEGLKLTLPVASSTDNETTHLAAVTAGHPEAGTPQFSIETVSSVTSSSIFDVTAIGNQASSHFVVALKSLTDANGNRRSNPQHQTPIEVINGTTITVRRPAVKEWLVGDRLYSASHYALTGDDELTVVLDGDTTGRRFVIPTYRKLKPVSATYGITNDLADKDNANLSLAKAFGLNMDWRDFAVFMPARTKSNQLAGVDTNKTMLWRYKRLGAEGNRARLQFTYPLAASSTTLVTLSPLNSQYTEIFVRLPSGPARTGVTYQNSSRLGYYATNIPSGGLYTYTYVLNLPITSARREVRLDFNTHVGTFLLGEVVTGGTSLATGTIQAGSTLSGASGTLIISTVTGSFLPGETITGGTSGSTAVLPGTQYGVARLTLGLPAGVSDHGFTVGNQLHMQYNTAGTTAGFLTSTPTVTITEVPDGTHIHYIESTTEIAPTANVGTVSYDTVENKTTGSTVIAGDIFNVGSGSSLPTGFETSIKIATLADGYMQGQLPVAGPGGGTLSWAQINAITNISWFPISGSGITAIAGAVNAQGASSPVTAVAVGDGLGDTSGQLQYATFEAAPNGLGGTDPWYYLTDGINYIRSNTNPVSDLLNYNFTFKNAITSSLATNSDWLNEDVRIVPITAENLVDYLNTSGPGGLFANGEIAAANRGGRPQIATLTVGSDGSVQVQGGTANAVSASVKGSATLVASTYAVLTVATSDTIGMSAGHWMKLENSIAVPKARVDSDTDLESITAAGVVTWGRIFLAFAAHSGTWTVGETVTGGTSGAVGTILTGSTLVGATGTLALGNVTGTFINGEALNGSVSGLGAATANGSQFFQGTKAWDFANTGAAPIAGRTWQFEKQGDFVAIQFVAGTSPDLSGVVEGDWLHVSNTLTASSPAWATSTVYALNALVFNGGRLYRATTGGTSLGSGSGPQGTGSGISDNTVIWQYVSTPNTRNQGLFRIVRIDNTSKTVWIENSNVFEETAVADCSFLTYDSIVPGDQLVIGTTDWGSNNLGTWTVASIDLSTYSASNGNNRWKFTLDISSRTPQVITGPGPAALGTASNLVRVVEGQASHLFKRIYGISVNPSDSSLTDIKFDTWTGAVKANEAAGTIIKGLDKLGFEATLAAGIDGYRHNVGLIEEANRVGYGVEADPSTYPGVIAAGANVNIQGPLIHRVQVSLALRRSSTGTSDIKDKVRSAVASVVNSTGVGEPVAISDIVSAAQSVNGVTAVTVLSPSFGPGNDLISIQPFEKPLILSLDEDVLISFVGE